MSGSARDVVVAGGGPVGLWLAAELKTAGVDVLVLEKRAERSPHSKALTLYPRTLELFAMRGLIGRWLEEGTPVPSSHYALLNTRLDFSFLDSRYPYTLFFPQVRTEELLEEYAISLGVPVLRGHAVTGVEQADDGVTVHTEPLTAARHSKRAMSSAARAGRVPFARARASNSSAAQRGCNALWATS
jgi:2-polyprenyl-6-methoxyphenol hydroxylase-like FAD-dependent oxidoreductase